MRTNLPSIWFRMYAEFATDPKVQMLSEQDQRRYLMLLCLRCSNGNVTLQKHEIAFQLRISESDLEETVKTLVTRKLVTSDGKPINWEKRQYRSDTSAARVSKHREKKKQESNGDVTLQKRPVEAEIEAEREVKDLKPKSTTESKPLPDKPAKFDFCESLIAMGVDKSVADDWLVLRKKLKAVDTQTALSGFVREVKKSGMSADAAVRECCLRGWKGFKADWVTGQARASPNQPRESGRQAAISNYAAQAAEARGESNGLRINADRDITGEAQRVA